MIHGAFDMATREQWERLPEGDQKCWYAIAAGVPFTSQIQSDGSLVFTTAPCDVQHDGRLVRVTWMQPDR